MLKFTNLKSIRNHPNSHDITLGSSTYKFNPLLLVFGFINFCIVYGFNLLCLHWMCNCAGGLTTIHLEFNYDMLGFNYHTLGFDYHTLGFNYHTLGFNYYALGFNYYYTLGFNYYTPGFNYHTLGLYTGV